MSTRLQDERFMRRALALARRGAGKTSPNPVVGAVLVRKGRIVGEGWHQFAGGAHAEVNALRKANGDTLYVTLEPCCTYGRTPPCTDAIIAAGIKRVVVAATDPNPRHRGCGIKILKKAGIKVTTNVLAGEAAALNPSFNKWIVTGMPLVVAKAALSLDGKMATRTGDSKWITSDVARREAHRLRASVDAVMVGANTVISDDPQLTLRHGVRGRRPWRVVVDGCGRSPKNARLFSDRLSSRTIVITTNASSAEWRQSLALRGVVVLVLPGKRGRMDLMVALRELGRMEVTSVLVEGGRDLLEACFDAGAVDRVVFFVAPKVIAGSAKVSSAKLAVGSWRKIGNEILFEGSLK